MCRNIALVLTLLLATVAFAVNTASDQCVHDLVSIIDNDVGDQPMINDDVNLILHCNCPAVVPIVIDWTGVLIRNASDTCGTTTIDLPQKPTLPILNATDGGFGDRA